MLKAESWQLKFGDKYITRNSQGDTYLELNAERLTKGMATNNFNYFKPENMGRGGGGLNSIDFQEGTPVWAVPLDTKNTQAQKNKY